MRRLLLPLLLPAVLCLAPAAGAAERWERADESIACSDTVGSAPFYNGDSASTVYDSTFKLGHAIPQGVLDGYVPQGLGAWKPASGPGLLIQAAYNDGTGRAVIAGMVPGGDKAVLTLLGPGKQGPVNAHVGGVAVVGSWLYITGAPNEQNGLPTVLRYSMPAVAEQFEQGGEIKAVGRQTLDVGTTGFATSFLAPDGNAVWAGTFDDNSRNRMYKFAVGASGKLTRVGGAGNWVQIPMKSQGLAVTNSHFLFSTSHTSVARSNVYVIRRGKKFLDKAYPEDLTCFAAPSMSQGIALIGGQAFMSFESGSFRYRTDPCDKGIVEGDCTRNILTHLHRASKKTLVGMT